MRRHVITLGIVIALIAVAGYPQQPSTFHLSGFLSARDVYGSGQEPWTRGGFGRLEQGGRTVDDSRSSPFGLAQLAVDWQPVSWFDVHAQGLGRYEPNGTAGKRAGIVEAYADLRGSWTSDQLQLRAGHFFLPTSRENRDALWTSPYTLTLSTLNSWVAEELRPIGVDTEWRHTFAAGSVFTLGGTAFRGNDSSGALLAWRGWSAGSRISVYNEVLPLPPLFSLHDARMFGEQRSDGTRPFGTDLDGRTGFAGRARVTLPGRGMLQLAHVDNRADRELYHGEYAWRTKLNILGGELGSPDANILVAEYANGSTGMGLPPKAFAQLDVHSGYLLLSHKNGRNRYTARIEAFGTNDRDHSIAETNTEHGRAWSLAWLYDVSNALRLGAEFTQITGNRLAAQESGGDPNMDGRSVIAELRYGF
jgi:hypothetical protein